MTVSDYFAELYVAGRFADAGWNVYFPHRDKGFDFIVSKPDASGAQIIRPVQVKGKYPTIEKGAKVVYGYIGRLTQTHPEMVLAIVLLRDVVRYAGLHRLHAVAADKVSCARLPMRAGFVRSWRAQGAP